MSRLKKRLKKAALAGAALYGASKLGMFGKTPVGSSGVVGKTPEFRKSFTSGKTEFPKLKVDSIGNVTKDGVTSVTKNKKTLFVNKDPKLGTGTGIYQGGKKIKDLNPNAINILKDGKISAKGKIFDGKKEYRKFMDAERAKKKATGFSKSTNKKNPGLFGFTFDKPLFKKGSMIKARGGGMARTKPTKMY